MEPKEMAADPEDVEISVDAGDDAGSAAGGERRAGRAARAAARAAAGGGDRSARRRQAVASALGDSDESDSVPRGRYTRRTPGGQ